MYIICSARSLWGHSCSCGGVGDTLLALGIPAGSSTPSPHTQQGWLGAGSGHPPAPVEPPWLGTSPAEKDWGCWLAAAEREPVCAKEGKRPMAPGLSQQ